MRPSRQRADLTGFTLLEILISITILAVIVGLIFSVISSLSLVWQRSLSDLDAFQNARTAFERITRNLSQATLNTYWDYQRDASGNPVAYIRQSDLQFVSGSAADTTLTGSVTHSIVFQAPVGRTEQGTLPASTCLMSVLGYSIAFQSDGADKPAWMTALPGNKNKSRFRLMELEQSAENFQVYGSTSLLPSWLGNTVSRPIADNCIALVLSPRLADRDDPTGAVLAPNYSYNSRQGAASSPQPSTANQLPPCVLVTLIAIAEKSAIQLTNNDTSPSALQTKITTILSGKFQQVSSYDADLAAVTASLTSNHIDYHVFTMWVPLLESKWTP